jgi:hypothetical protein
LVILILIHSLIDLSNCYVITNNMSDEDEWPSGRSLKWYEKIIISSAISLCIFSGIYISIWIASVEMNIYVIFIIWIFICMIVWTMLQVKKSINYGCNLE